LIRRRAAFTVLRRRCYTNGKAVDYLPPTWRVTNRHRRRSDRGRWTGKLHPRGTDHGRNAVRTSTGAVLERRHQV